MKRQVYCIQPHRGRPCHPHGSRHRCPCHGHAHVNNTQSGLHPLCTACSLSTWETEAGGLEFKAIFSNVETSLGYMRPCSNKQNPKGNQKKKEGCGSVWPHGRAHPQMPHRLGSNPSVKSGQTKKTLEHNIAVFTSDA